MKLSLLLVSLLSCQVVSATVFVSPKGNDEADGKAVTPVRTLERALDLVRNLPVKHRDICVKSGLYRLEETVRITAADSGVRIRAEAPGYAIFSGAVPVTKWTRDKKDKNIFTAPFPYDFTTKREFRVLTTGTNLCELASFPGFGEPKDQEKYEEGYLHTTSFFPYKIMQGGVPSEPVPKPEEEVTMTIDHNAMPKGLDFRKLDFNNAWLLMYHMWFDSPCAVISNQVAKGILYLHPKPQIPPGSLNDRFELMNTPEGLRHGGMWLSDHTAGKLVYRARQGETPENLDAQFSKLYTLIKIDRAENVTISGIVFEGCSSPWRHVGFGGRSTSAAVEFYCCANPKIDRCKIHNVSGIGLRMVKCENAKIVDCDLGDTGSCALDCWAYAAEISGNRMHDVGTSTHTPAVAYISGEDIKFTRNKVWMGPYCGVIMDGWRHLYASNDVSHVMRVLQDGAALYGVYHECVIRDNFHHDMMRRGFPGFGSTAYYSDEGSHANLFTGNRSENVRRSVHLHITRDNVVSNNVFCQPGDMSVSYQNSINGSFVDNKCYYLGKFTYNNPANYGEWARNQLFRGRKLGQPLKTYQKDGDGDYDLHPMGPESPYVAGELAKPPIFDGFKDRDEWPDNNYRFHRDEFGCYIGGYPSYLNIGYDKEYMYFLITVSYYPHEKISDGHQYWRSDSATVELGKKGFIITFYVDGTVTCSDSSIVWSQGENYCVTRKYRLVYYEAKVPYSVIGRKGPGGGEIPFNVWLYRGEYDEPRYFDAPSLSNPVPGTLILGEDAGNGNKRKAK